MNKLKKLLIIIALIVFFILLGLFLVGYFHPKTAAINVFASEPSSVFIDGQFVGKTPFQKNIKPEQISLKLVTDNNQNTYQTKVLLTPGVETIVKRDFNEESSAGEVVSFEKIPEKKASFAIVSAPDKAQIMVDNKILGFAPLEINNLGAGEHSVVVSLTGFVDRSLPIKTYFGYKLTAIVDLEKAANLPVLSEKVEKIVKILSTPNGFLRVRENQSTSSAELAQIQPGSVYNFDEEQSGWFRIEYSPGLYGWISSQYAEVIEKSN